MNSSTKTLSPPLETHLVFGGSSVDSSVEKIRNISQTGMKNRRNIGLFLFLIAILCVIFLPLDSQSVLGICILFGLFTGGTLTLLESRTQVCVYHGFQGTHESSSGMKKHDDVAVSEACRRKSGLIIIQSVISGLLLTLISYVL